MKGRPFIVSIISISIIAFLFNACPKIVSASYEIQLKNGKTYVIHNYWEEGDLIKFHFHGGVIGIQKDTIKSIKDSDAPVVVSGGGPFWSGDAEESNKRRVKRDIPKEGSDGELALKGKKASLERQLKDTLDRYREAKQSDNNDSMSIEFRKVSEISAALEDLKKEVKEIYNWDLPDWWNKESDTPP
ncbi:hypothetical protein JXL19_01065 [bacterium]|nr:hypothetical protein [bacterium]